MAGGKRLQAFPEIGPEAGRALHEAVAEHDPELLEGGRGGQRVARIGAGPRESRLVPGLLRERPGGDRAADAEPRGHALAEGDHVGDDPEVLEPPHAPGAGRRELGLVEDEQRAPAVGEVPEARQPLGGRDHHAPGDRNGLGEDGGDVPARDVLHQLLAALQAGHVARRVLEVDGAAVAERGVDRVAVGRHHERPEVRLAAPADAGDRFGGEAAAVQPPDERDDVVLPGRPEGEAHRDLVRLGAGDREVHDLEVPRHRARDQLGQLDEPRVGVPGGLVHELPRLLADRLRQLRMRVAEHHAHHAGRHVEVLVAVHVGEHDAAAALEHDAGLVAPPEDVLLVAGHEVVVAVGELEILRFHRRTALVVGDGSGAGRGARPGAAQGAARGPDGLRPEA